MVGAWLDLLGGWEQLSTTQEARLANLEGAWVMTWLTSRSKAAIPMFAFAATLGMPAWTS